MYKLFLPGFIAYTSTRQPPLYYHEWWKTECICFVCSWMSLWVEEPLPEMLSIFFESCVPVCVCVCCVDAVDYCHVASFTLEVSSIHSKSRASRAHTHTHTQGSSHTVAHRHKHTQTHTYTPFQTMALPRFVHPARFRLRSCLSKMHFGISFLLFSARCTS